VSYWHTELSWAHFTAGSRDVRVFVVWNASRSVWMSLAPAKAFLKTSTIVGFGISDVIIISEKWLNVLLEYG